MSPVHRALLPVVALAVLVAGCTDGPDETAAADASLAACVVPTPGAVEVAQDAPLGFAGYDVDVLQHVADELGRDLELVRVGFDDAVAGVPTAADRCDVVAAALVDDGTVAEPLVPSTPYRDEVLVVVGRGQNATDLQFTAEDPLGHVRGDLVRDVAEAVTADVVAFPSVMDAAAALDARTVRALLLPPADAAQVAGELEGVAARTAVRTGNGVVLGLAGDVDDAEREALDGAVASWPGSTAARDAAARWLGTARVAEVPPPS